MEKRLDYSIDPASYPAEDAVLTPAQLRKNKNINFLLILVASVVTFILAVNLGNLVGYYIRGRGDRVLGAVVFSFFFSVFLDYIFRRATRRKMLQEKRRKVSDVRVNRASSQSAGLVQNLHSTARLLEEIPRHISNASAWIQRAREEYRGGAFSPFWDAIETAALEISEARSKIVGLSHNSDAYHRQLVGLTHNFPVFPLDADDVPDISSVTRELNSVVRLGQTNFQFANIWEHRRTRACLIEGFSNLGDAVDQMGGQVALALENLRSSMSSDIGRLVREQIQTRDSLDRIGKETSRKIEGIQLNQHVRMAADDN